VIPYTFPREFGVVLSYAMNNRRDAVYHLSALPRIAPWALPLLAERNPRTGRTIDGSARAADGAMRQGT
jgi:D-amino-acid dehydrogenase